MVNTEPTQMVVYYAMDLAEGNAMGLPTQVAGSAAAWRILATFHATALPKRVHRNALIVEPHCQWRNMMSRIHVSDAPLPPDRRGSRAAALPILHYRRRGRRLR
jgi:hypothetical protein